MKKAAINKDKCKDIALTMQNFSFEHPEARREFQDSEKELFYLFALVAICHQINWNFLMGALRKVQKDYPAKFTPNYMKMISDKEIFDWLSDYPKKWRLDKRFKISEVFNQNVHETNKSL